MNHNDYTTIKIPIELIQQVDDYIESNKHLGFTSRVELIKTALRSFLMTTEQEKNTKK